MTEERNADRTDEGQHTGRKILIVDDNPDAAESLGELLKVSGHEVRISYDGENAVHEAAYFHPEVVILDIGLPTIDGYEVARRIRADPGLTPSLLVALSGYEQDPAGTPPPEFDYHFVKPLDFEKLASLLHSRA